jgi:hypothetical protein
MAGQNDLFDDDVDREEAEDEFQRLREALLAVIEDFIEAEDLDGGTAVELLIDAALSMRMADYGMVTEKPSVAGFKLDLDRFRQDIEGQIRDAKKSAEDYIAMAKEARARQAAEEDKDDPGV